MISAVGCKKDEVLPPDPTPPPIWTQAKADVLTELGKNVIIPAAIDFDNASNVLVTAVNTLTTTPTQDHLDAARLAWRKARRPWELFEAFLFGPAKNQQLDPAIDSWPLDLNTVNAVLESGNAITVDRLNQEEGTARGFHAIEYFLFGLDGKKTVEKFTPREYEYLTAATQAFRTATSRLRSAWEAKNENDSASYQWQLAHAQLTGSLYTTQDAALKEVVTSIGTLSNELEASKMGIPYHSPDNSFEEARFSNNSKDDFKANLEGIQSIYLGSYQGDIAKYSGKGISALVTVKDGGMALDAQIKAEFQEGFDRIALIQPTFADAINGTNNGSKNSVNGAITAVQKVEATLTGALPTLLFKK
ncbi:MAG: imelysin family protein [Candidatus Kapaibacterium sp.]